MANKIFNFVLGVTFAVIFMLLGMTVVVANGYNGFPVAMGAFSGLVIYDLLQRAIKAIVARVYR